MLGLGPLPQRSLDTATELMAKKRLVRRPPTVHLARRIYSRCENEPLQMAISALGWREVTKAEDASIIWDLWLNDSEASMHVAPSATQILSRFPAMADGCRKAAFAKLHSRLARLLRPGVLDDGRYIPQQWALPLQHNELLAHLQRLASLSARGGKGRKRTFIVKPDSGSQGDGIHLTTDPLKASWDTSKDRVVQEYIDTPMLLDGLKFDLRLYVLVASIDPMRAFLCHEGLARFAVDSYEPPAHTNMRNVHMHVPVLEPQPRTSRVLLSLPSLPSPVTHLSRVRASPWVADQLLTEQEGRGLQAQR